jgi:single-strand DNA-binding protein
MPNTQASLVGNLTADPKLNFTKNGKAVTSLSIAVNEGRRGEEQITSFYDITAWGSLGEHAAESLHKGNRIMVIGTLQQRSWETNEGRRSKVEIVAEALGPDLRFAHAEPTSAPVQGSLPEAHELPGPAEQRALVAAARAAVEHPGAYNPPSEAREYDGSEF